MATILKQDKGLKIGNDFVDAVTNNKLLSDRVFRNDKDIAVLNENVERNRKLYVEKEKKFSQEKSRFEDITKNIPAKENEKSRENTNKK